MFKNMWKQDQGKEPKEEQEKKELKEKPIQELGKVERLNQSPEENQETRTESEKLNIYDEILTKAKLKKKGVIIHHEVKGDAEKVSQKDTAEKQIERLVKLAQQKGVVHAVKVAQHMENNYVLDGIHDQMSLGERMYQALQKEKIVD